MLGPRVTIESRRLRFQSENDDYPNERSRTVFTLGELSLYYLKLESSAIRFRYTLFIVRRGRVLSNTLRVMDRIGKCDLREHIRRVAARLIFDLLARLPGPFF